MQAWTLYVAREQTFLARKPYDGQF